MIDTLKLIGMCLLPVVFVALIIGMGVYKFNDCLDVGHSVPYCIMDLR